MNRNRQGNPADQRPAAEFPAAPSGRTLRSASGGSSKSRRPRTSTLDPELERNIPPSFDETDDAPKDLSLIAIDRVDERDVLNPASSGVPTYLHPLTVSLSESVADDPSKENAFAGQNSTIEIKVIVVDNCFWFVAKNRIDYRPLFKLHVARYFFLWYISLA